MSMRESTRRVARTTRTRTHSEALAPGTRHLRFFAMPEVMARLRQHQRDADKIYYGVNPNRPNRLGEIQHRVDDYISWVKERSYPAGVDR